MDEYLTHLVYHLFGPALISICFGLLGYFLARKSILGNFEYVYWTILMLCCFFFPFLIAGLGIHMAETYVYEPTPEFVRFLCVAIPFSVLVLFAGLAWGASTKPESNSNLEEQN